MSCRSAKTLGTFIWKAQVQQESWGGCCAGCSQKVLSTGAQLKVLSSGQTGEKDMTHRRRKPHRAGVGSRVGVCCLDPLPSPERVNVTYLK